MREAAEVTERGERMVIDINAFLMALLGGVVIGVAAAMLLLLVGRIAGISGITSGLVKPVKGEVPWRAAFVGGLVMGGVGLLAFYPQAFPELVSRGPLLTAIAGLLVGVGTQLGSGCTSGHGVCGISRLSGRSIVATITFISAGAIAVVVMRAMGLA